MLALIYKLLLAPIVRLYIKKVEGLEYLPRGKGFILAFHHESYADGLLATASLPLGMVREVHGLGEEGLFHLKGWRRMISFLLKISRTIPTNGGVNKVIKYYKKHPKAVVLIAPLLWRATKPYKVGPGTGVAVIAIESQVPVVPVGIYDSKSIWPMGFKHPKSLRPRRKIIVRYGKPLEFKKYYGKKVSIQIYRKVAKEIVREIERLSRRKVGK
jgi:1-acyl-sn-glycerol-3-phosphate acyltransferase